MKRLIVTVAIFSLASAAAAQPVVYLDLPCSRDNFNSDQIVIQEYANIGAEVNGRIAKDHQETTLYCDWDEFAMQDLADTLAGLTPGSYEVVFRACGTTWDAPNPTFAAYVETFKSENDWVEGDGVRVNGLIRNFTWTEGTPAATNMYAETYYFDGGDGILGSGDETLDTDNCVAWVDPDTSTPGEFWDMPAVTTNTLQFGAWNTGGDPANPAWNDVVLDQAVVDDLLSDRATTYVRGLRCYDDTWPNEQCYARGQWGTPGVCPRLVVREVSIVLPIPGDSNDDGWVDGADYTAWADNYDPDGSGFPAWSEGGWTVGNFTEDDVVDGADYTVWADEYNPPPSGAVPEPATLSLLAVAGIALIRRRRR